MAVEDRAKELNTLAEKIQGAFTNFRTQFKIIYYFTLCVLMALLNGKKVTHLINILHLFLTIIRCQIKDLEKH